MSSSPYHLFPTRFEEGFASLSRDELIEDLKRMLLIRHFETRAEAAYLSGKVGGFFHSYIGQEAIQVAAVRAFGLNNWYTTSYRCHALALLLGASPNELMAELYGRKTGNAKGRGGSMHFYTSQLLGGFGIVGGQIPIATGAAFTCKYLEQNEKVSLCFLGEGAVAQGSFHESLNLAALWSLPAIYVIENNQWGMGTAVSRAISVQAIAEKKAPGFGFSGYTVDGMDYFHLVQAFRAFKNEIITQKRPVLIEALTERFKGHSISDPGHYRSKEELSTCMKEKDPLLSFKTILIQKQVLTEEEFSAFDKEIKDRVLASMKFADESPWPDLASLEEEVMAP